MAAGSYNFTIEQGATFDRTVTVQENGAAMNLTGYTPRMQVRSTHDSSSIVLTVTCSISDGTGGVIRLQASATTTAGVEEGIYVYDLEIESSAGVVTRLMQGNATVTPEVTR